MNRIYTSDEFVKVYKPGMEFEYNSTSNNDNEGWCRASGDHVVGNERLKYRIIGKDDNMQNLKEYTLDKMKKVWKDGDEFEYKHPVNVTGRWTNGLALAGGRPHADGLIFRFKDINTQNLRDPQKGDTKMTKKKRSAKHSDVGNVTGKIPVGTIVWKKIYDSAYNNLPDRLNTGVYIAKLITLSEGVVPKDARYPLSLNYLRKVRAPKVAVIQIYQFKNGKLLSRPSGVRLVSAHDWKTEWNQGTVVESPQWDDDEFTTCTSGIHFYRTLDEAKRH